MVRHRESRAVGSKCVPCARPSIRRPMVGTCITVRAAHLRHPPVYGIEQVEVGFDGKRQTPFLNQSLVARAKDFRGLSLHSLGMSLRPS